jgi:leucyl-tRNA synthetase
MIKIGITGLMGAGKSFIARQFNDRGVPIYNTDVETRRLQQENESLRSEIISLLGEQAYLEGGLNRQWVASQIFGDEELKNKFMGLVGPYLLSDIDLFYEQNKDADMVLLESAILFETPLVEKVDKVIFVQADEEVRMERANKRDGITAENYKLRMSSQIPEEEKVRRSDYVILNNDGDVTAPRVVEIINDNKKMKEQEYVLVMFPYPSGDGLHVGHAYNYAIMDSYCNWRRLMGVEVFQPFGYDSFGLPAENFAKKMGRDPREVTYENIGKFRSQMTRMNTKFEELLITSDPSYQKWTQWLFTKLLEHGLAYKKMGVVNYCPSCETVLANEQAKSGHCERCSTAVEHKELEQWYFKTTAFKNRLIKNLSWIDYPEKTKKQQLHWLENLTDWCVSRQRSWGCPIPVEGETDTLDTFVDSSIYFLRYLDPNNDNELFAPEKYRQVDLYVGGTEHACMHLIYSRFINMFLYDIGLVPCEEPFKKLIHQGMITHEGEKMSKSKGNVVSPDDYNPAELRMYLSFLGHYFDGGDWSDSHILGIRRFLGRFKTWTGNASIGGENIDLSSLRDKINGFVMSFKFNKVVSTLMEFYNSNKGKQVNLDTARGLEEIMECFASGHNK